MATEDNAYPINKPGKYEHQTNGLGWDADKIYGCVCDSTWPVGLGAGQTQEAEWFGADCSKRHCPSGDDPMDAKDGFKYYHDARDKATNCSGIVGDWGRHGFDSGEKRWLRRATGGVGEDGNLCHIDCSNRGRCDYSTGTCKCFADFYGHNCGKLTMDADSALAGSEL
jgi:hypothetical protein